MPQTGSSPDLVVCARLIRLLPDGPQEALLVRAGRVAGFGSATEMRALAAPGARVLELGDAVVTAGFTDAHVHLTSWALSRQRVDLNAAATLDDGLAAVARAAADGEGWLRGMGWDVHRWGRLPTRQELDAASPTRPCYFESHDIHGAWLNSAALSRCGITAATPDPEGGSIVRDAAGEPTGVLLEKAMALAERHLPAPSLRERVDALKRAQGELHALGLTGVHSVEVTGMEDFSALQAEDGLRLRVLQAVPLPSLDEALAQGHRSGQGGEWLRLGGVKMFLDGALGSRTAWLREPYIGEQGCGIQTLPADEFRHHVQRAAAGGLASTVHAIGDAAVELALNVLSSVPRPAAMPHRIEHLQLCPADLWLRAGRSGVVASMQPVHLRTDIPVAERHWGEARSHGAYPFAAVRGAGMTLAFGSDVPVETVDPRQGLFAAQKRVAWDGTPAGGWHNELALDASTALYAYTEGPAIAAGAADQGWLLPGYHADLVAWDRDPVTATPDEVTEMRCLATVVAGEVVFRE